MFVLLALVVACGDDATKPEPPAGAPPTPAAEIAPAQPPTAPPDGVVEVSLGDTAWQLVALHGADGNAVRPPDPGAYTLELLASGRVALRADCNRGSGSWSSSGPGTVQFGTFATTRAMCPPGSLHDRYLVDLSLIRSYAVENGNLLLRAEGGGSVEMSPLAPAPPPASPAP